MPLTPEQKQAVASWIAAGDSLSIVQKKLSEQFKVSMTYMDVRFLVDDLGLELKSAATKPEPKLEDVSKSPAPVEKKEKGGLFDKLKKAVGAGGEDDIEEPTEELVEEEPVPEELPPIGPSNVSVDVDMVVRPGMVVSGTVTFSDGVTGKWALDQYGRLMLDTSKKGYQPNAADVQTFQQELSLQLQKRGY